MNAIQFIIHHFPPLSQYIGVCQLKKSIYGNCKRKIYKVLRKIIGVGCGVLSVFQEFFL